MDTNFVKVDRGNLPRIDMILVGFFLKYNPYFNAAKLRNVKTVAYVLP